MSGVNRNTRRESNSNKWMTRQTHRDASLNTSVAHAADTHTHSRCERAVPLTTNHTPRPIAGCCHRVNSMASSHSNCNCIYTTLQTNFATKSQTKAHNPKQHLSLSRKPTEILINKTFSFKHLSQLQAPVSSRCCVPLASLHFTVAVNYVLSNANELTNCRLLEHFSYSWATIIVGLWADVPERRSSEALRPWSDPWLITSAAQDCCVLCW